MTQLRRVLAPMTALWLFCQIGTVVLFPVVLWTTSADPEVADCTCVHGPDMVCPMHQKPARDSSACGMQAAHTDDAVLSTLAGAAGVVPESISPIGPADAMKRVEPASVRIASLRPVPPDPPPPRA